MKSYLLSLFSAALLITLIGILAPKSTAKQLRLIASLFLICILSAPLPNLIRDWKEWTAQGTFPPESGSEGSIPYDQQLQEALNSASKSYFAQSLTSMLEQRFSIASGDLRCAIRWEEDDGQLKPTQVTILLSGKAIWKNPAQMEEFVTQLLGCECQTAIESRNNSESE